ncbi:unnamed protein product [Microthlaspi erraticum]|uniref:Uncharacterized protein n=1 Tax=Microthlaspi erraticum TaxID=1685480 RepID=A0A6D2JRN3_9BRAS|nr:unnamed protein product [Microthlaspi erraticum]
MKMRGRLLKPDGAHLLLRRMAHSKAGWDKLKQAYEGTSNVKRSRIDMLATRFETLRMGESETIEEFSGKLSSIANEAQNMGRNTKTRSWSRNC